MPFSSSAASFSAVGNWLRCASDEEPAGAVSAELAPVARVAPVASAVPVDSVVAGRSLELSGSAHAASNRVVVSEEASNNLVRIGSY